MQILVPQVDPHMSVSMLLIIIANCTNVKATTTLDVVCGFA